MIPSDVMYRLAEVLPAPSGERLLLRVVSPEGETVTVNISCGAYKKLSLSMGELDASVAKKLLETAKYEKAVMKGISILGYGPNSVSRLSEKLRIAGFSEVTACRAAEYLEKKGYIDEKKDAVRLCESMIGKRYGKRRILSSIRAKGYGDGGIMAAEEYLSGVDFVELCASAARAKFKYLPSDSGEMKKTLAKLLALGYNVSEAKAALKLLSREDRA